MNKLWALCIVVIFVFIISGCDRADLLEFARSGGRAATPVFTPAPGSYLTADGFAGQVEISCATGGAVIVYTVDDTGATPPDPEYDIDTATVIAGTLYAEGAPVSVAVPGTTIIRARAYVAGRAWSAIAHGEYVVDQAVDAPYFSLAAGVYYDPIDVEIFCDTPGVSIRYTTGEFDYPTETTGMSYTGNPVRITQPTYLRAMAYRAGMVPVTSEIYFDVVTVTPTVEMPYFTPDGGTHYDPFDVEIYCDTLGAEIYYSYDDVTYAQYSSALTIAGATSLYAYATAPGMNNSLTASTEYYFGTRTVSFTSASQTSAEGSGVVTVTMELSASSVSAVTVPFNIEIEGTATQSADFTIDPTSTSPLIIPAGSNSGTITVTLSNDNTYEGNETIVLAMGTPENATASGVTVHTITITDDVDLPVVAFDSPPDWDIDEPTSGSSPLYITIRLTGDTSLDASVNYAVTAGTATGGGTDYTLDSGTVNIPAGAFSMNISSTIYADAEVEGDETFIVTLSDPVNAQLGINQYTVTIHDNPPARWGAVGSGVALYSPDGLTWYPASNASGVLRSVATDGTNCVAVLDSGIVNYSSDGKVWSAGTGLSGNFYGVCTNTSGTWLALGEAGTYRSYSTNNGASWNTISQIATTNYGCTFDGSVWYAAGAGGNIYYTTDYAGTWDSTSPTGMYDLYAIDVDGTNCLAAGAYGNIVYSTDGCSPGTLFIPEATLSGEWPLTAVPTVLPLTTMAISITRQIQQTPGLPRARTPLAVRSIQ